MAATTFSEIDLTPAQKEHAKWAAEERERIKAERLAAMRGDQKPAKPTATSREYTQIPSRDEPTLAMAKVNRYGWTVVDSPGRFEMIDKTKLLINHDYQREEVASKVREIASAWSWTACAAICVAMREGKYYVFDGQQRTLAALNRVDIKELPCLVFEIADVRDEALGFLRINTLRKPVTAIEKFRAKVMVGDQVAIRVLELIESAGYRIAETINGQFQVSCVSAIEQAVQQKRSAIERVWPVIVEAGAGAPIINTIVRGIVHLEDRIHAKGVSLADKRWREKACEIGLPELAAGARKAEVYYGRGGDKVWAEGIANRLNKGLRGTKLPFGSAAIDELENSDERR